MPRASGPLLSKMIEIEEKVVCLQVSVIKYFVLLNLREHFIIDHVNNLRGRGTFVIEEVKSNSQIF